MNHLAHLLCGWDDTGLLAGAFLGDHHKGALTNLQPAWLQPGVELHRAIDAFSDQHPVTLTSRLRFERRFRRYGGIMVDIIYDHLLARQWPAHHTMAIEAFSSQALGSVLRSREHLPPTVIQTCERMLNHGSLSGYRDEVFIERSFNYLSGKLRHDNPLAEGLAEFHNNAEGLQKDFADFFPELRSFVNDWRHDRSL